MKTATIRDLRNDFARLSKWLDKGETIKSSSAASMWLTSCPSRRQTKVLAG